MYDKGETIDSNYVESQSGTMAKSFVSNVFSLMFAALGISGVIAYWFGTDLSLLSYLLDFQQGGMTILGYVVMFAPLLLVFVMAGAMNKMSSGVLMVVFVVYAALMGMSLSFIFLAYTMSSIAVTFGVTAATFGVMAIVGYTTSTDLTKFGGIMMMALVGIIIASVVNWFMQSESMDYIISIIGVLVFTGLTAYDVQKIKRIGSGVEYGAENTKKLAIMGALSLYLDFVNLFLFLLRFLGSRD